MQIIATTPTPDLGKSLTFYEKCNFQLQIIDGINYVKDGPLIVEIADSKTHRPGIKCYNVPQSVIDTIQKTTTVLETEAFYLCYDPSGVSVYMMKENLSKLESDDLWAKAPASILGKYAGISIESIDMAKSVKFYGLLGLEPTMGKIENGWISLSNDQGFSISIMALLMCPHMFTNPSFTYFNSGKNTDNIAKIREQGIEITEEITEFNDRGIVDNIIIREPGGYGFFVFND